MKKMNFCKDWLFRKQGAQESEKVSLPHDAMIHEHRDPGSHSGSAGAFFPGGVYEYEKTFSVPADWQERCVSFCFEGVYKNSKVYINGQEVGGCVYGYSQFYVSADNALKYGEENTIKVIANNADMPNSRWYTGSGIYRPVWLLLSAKSHINTDGVRISTISYNPAIIRVDVDHSGGDNVLVEVLKDGKTIADGQGDSIEFTIPDAALWSDVSPNLYQCKVQLMQDGMAVDEITDSFGIRFIEWSPRGLFINGKETLLRGGCVHHDNGILGACSYEKSEYRRVRLLKEAGFNAIRSSHNPASVAMLKACDELGVYMIDETWDMWYKHKNKYDYASDFNDNYRFDVEALVRRDYNHPSIIMYSIANEVDEPAFTKGQELTRELVDLIHSLDGTRPVTGGFNLMIIKQAAKGKAIYKDDGGLGVTEKPNPMNSMNSTMFNMITQMVGTGMNKSANSKKADQATSPCLDMLDIAGYNYGSGRYPKERTVHPERIIFGSETFPQDIVKNWAMVKQYPYLIGDFMWTAWDYLGENGLGAWAYTSDGKGFNKPYPWLLAECGVLDILGNPTGEVYLAQAAWGLLDKPVIAVQPVNHPGVKPAKAVWRGTNAIPTWAWKGCEGNKAVIEVYTTADSVELLLNGKSIGRKRVKNYVAKFNAKYVPGRLVAIGYDAQGNELGRGELQSAADKPVIRVTPEESVVAAGDITYIAVEITGENGVVEANADIKLDVTVEGGELLAFGSANPRTADEYTAGSHTTYYGKALAVVRCGESKNVKITATGDGMLPVSETIAIK